MGFNYLYLPIGVPTFHLESAGKEFDKSVALLKSVDDSVIVPDEMLLSLDKLHAFIDDKHPDFVVVQNITFANGAYMTEILRTLDCPALLWTLKEPVIDGGRLRLNSLTGAFSAGIYDTGKTRAEFSLPRKRQANAAGMSSLMRHPLTLQLGKHSCMNLMSPNLGMMSITSA